MIASSQVGEKLIFTKVQMGDGIIGETEDIQDFISLKQPKMDLTIQKSENKGNGQIEIVAVVDNSGLMSGFFGRELGLFAKIGDLGEEKLYCYTNSGTQADYISADPIEDGTPYKDFIAIDAVIGSSQNVTVVVDESKIYVTEERLESHNEDPNAHKDLLEKLPSGVPVGTIIPWAGTMPPPGFMICNGASLFTTTYSGLFAAIGYTWGGSGNVFNLPDFVTAARFLRSMGNGLSVGDVQEDAIRNISGRIGRTVTDGNQNGVFYGEYIGHSDSLPKSAHAQYAAFMDASLQVPTADENRPKSAVVMYCIKVTDEYINPEQVNISEVANALANKADRIEVRELAGTRLWRSDVDGGYDLTPVNNTPTIVEHGLNLSDPLDYKCDVRLICVAPEQGYSAGDEAVGWISFAYNGRDTFSFAPSPSLSTNSIQYNTGHNGNGMYALHKTNGTSQALVLKNWRYVFRIWY